jgi:hypothetical protein
MSAPAPPPNQVVNAAAMTVMRGGARTYTIDLLQKYAKPLELYVGIGLVLGIIYVRQTPELLRAQASSTVGRIFLFLLTVIVADTYSWIYGLLMALLTVLLIAEAPRANERREGFQDSADQDYDMKMVAKPRKWFIEEVLGENPVGIEEEKVRTSAVQDQGGPSNSTTSSR